MRFSEFYQVTRGPADDWFDTFLPADTPLFVDPFPIYDDALAPWTEAHDKITEFFGMTFSLVSQANGDETSITMKKAKKLLLFPEPREFCFGVAEGSPNGSGAGKGLQIGMLDGIKTAIGLGLNNVDHLETLVLFQGGMGVDRISDAVCNVLKSLFIAYTQDVCRRHGVPMESFRVRNASWSEEHARWEDRDVDLPLNPMLARRTPVLLAPTRFLKDIPVITADSFWDYAWQNHADDLRTDFNYDIGRKVARHIKAKMARQNVSIVMEYLAKMENNRPAAYDPDSDPQLRVTWWERSAPIARAIPATPEPTDLNSFVNTISTMIDCFKLYVEHQGGWELLWNGKKPHAERGVQRLFRGIVMHYCKANKIVISGGSDAGRGPVDFKFSAGYEAQALTEIKLMKSTKLWNGILQQTPTYAGAEEVKIAFYVAVAYTDNDMKPERMEKVEKAARMAERKFPGLRVIPVQIDARPKQSASTLVAPAAELDELHGRS